MSKNRNKTRPSNEPDLLVYVAITSLALIISGILIAGALTNGF